MEKLTAEIIKDQMIGETNGQMASVPNNPIIFSMFSTYNYNCGNGDWNGNFTKFLKDIVNAIDGNVNNVRNATSKINVNKNISYKEIDGMLDDDEKAVLEEFKKINSEHYKLKEKVKKIVTKKAEKLPQFNSYDFFSNNLYVDITGDSFYVKGTMSVDIINE